jgi:RNA polymerase sigma factor (sigma-70 family)
MREGWPPGTKPLERAHVQSPPRPTVSLMSDTGLQAVFLANRDRLLRFLSAHGAGDAAEDVLQELWIKLSTSTTGPIAQPLSYLYRAANNLMLDRYRSVRQAARRDSDWSDVEHDLTDRAQDPVGERPLIAREQLRLVQETLDALGERVALSFRRHRIDGIPQKDIARELGVSLSTVETDLRKAYRALIEVRRQLDEG